MNNIFNDAKKVEYNGEEIKSIITANGGVIWKKQEEPSTDYLTFTITTNPYNYPSYSNAPIFTEDNITIDWGDGTTETVTNLYEKSHSYFDNSAEHTITLIGTNTEIPSNTFNYYNPITEIYIPSTVTILGTGAFNKSSLSSITFAENIQLTEIPDSCFSQCTNLTNITIPNGVISLGQKCFSRCTKLTSVVIPNSVTSLGDFCFGNCNILVNYQLYWKDSAIIGYVSNKMPNNTNTIFTIPYGETANYIEKGYPSDKLVERQN